MEQQDLKYCYKCGESKPLDQFSKNSRAVDGKQSACKACNKKDNDQYRKDKPDFFREWYNRTPTNKQKFIETVYKCNASEGGGIYSVLNIQDKKIYIGHTAQFKRRRAEHFAHRNSEKNNTNKNLREDIKRLGRESFEWIVLEKCKDLSEDNLMKKELKWLKTFIESDLELYNTIQYDKGTGKKWNI